MGSIEEPKSFTRAKLWLPTTGAAPPDSSSIFTLPDLVDFNAQHNPDHVFCYQARKRDDGSVHLIEITHKKLRELVLCCQSWLRSRTAEHISKSRPVALFMESDVGLWIHMLALLGLGVPALLLSARLSPNAIRHLMEKTNAGAALSSPRLRSTVDEALALGDKQDAESLPKLFERQSLEQMIEQLHASSPSPVKAASVTYPGFYRGTQDREVIIMHSSGTTGLPKPIYQPHEYLVGFAAAHGFAEGETPPFNLSTLPLYHASHLRPESRALANTSQGFGLCAPGIAMSIGMTLCLPVSNVASGSSVIELLRTTGASSLMTVPSTLEDISLLPDNSGAKALQKMRFVAFGGGPLKISVGEKLASNGVPLLNHYGATEIGAICPIFDPRKSGIGYDFHFFRIRTDHNIVMETVPSAPGEQALYKLTARPFGWDSVFEVQDNLVASPEYPKTDFNSLGRNDDLIVLATGEKVLPNILETAVSESEHCKAAIAIGQSQFQIGLLVEPKGEVYEWDFESFRDALWPVVERANQLMDAQGRISSKKAIAIVPAGQTLPRTDKGSIQRKEVYRVFDELINETFRSLEEDDLDDDSLPLLDTDNLESEIKSMIQERLTWKVPEDQWTAEDDLFDLGMDSLQAIQLRRLLTKTARKNATKPEDESIPREFVYSHPSVSKLAAAVRGQGNAGDVDLINKYVGEYKPSRGSGGSVVLLTGSTGSLGSHIVADLVEDPTVSQVICLIRPREGDETPLDRQFSALSSKHLDISGENLSKIRAYATNTSSYHLGLQEDDYAFIRDSVTHIIHNAWPMDFNRQLPSFESQFMALDNLIWLSRSAFSRRPSTRQTFVFISSIATVGNYPDLSGEQIVREIPMENNDAVDDFGYARAKLVCERIVEDLAANASNEVDAKYVRVGQMTGAQTSGLWNTTEHFPSLAKSSKFVGALPQLKGTLSWLPVDLAAATVTDITFSGPGASNIFHVENPIRQSWRDVLSTLAPAIGLAPDAQVPYSEWLDRIRAVSDDRMGDNPAKKLLAFFEGDFEHMSGGDVIMDTAETRRVSKTLRQTGGVDENLISKYVDMWKHLGFLQ
ncbi:hypothetical protein M409DRAFT_16197 [Zasmidium cellare ATCC 36951]|uniref:Carrier domain-containing protein n=1 Tax=Zasmidium cellare ATCC 36951 TaxID=1080233 RepID=A0A6A6D6Y4_ZASCE|nr:uncharacterized protein M409DRAFT_16197 [Zasmidium cellare ATCC 36951]KAF2173929.1 hypothetical protein M409DRAFT_16197 [Zasmidium cellare ATCC 36951]